ncbi:MAG TPA: ABC transporter substrate-binding protein [Rhizobium sp.]
MRSSTHQPSNRKPGSRSAFGEGHDGFWTELQLRRGFLLTLMGAGSALLVPKRSMASDDGNLPKEIPRIITLDAALTQTALALGVTPMAVCSRYFYAPFVMEPTLPGGVLELGQRTEPNLELIAELRPSAIFYSPEFGNVTDTLRTMVPVVAIPIYQPEQRSFFDGAIASVRMMAAPLKRETMAEQYIQHVASTIEKARDATSAYRGKSFCLFSFLNDRRARVYTDRSLLGSTLKEIGFSSATDETGNEWGFFDMGMERLADLSADEFVHIGDLPPRTEASPVWKVLPFVRADRLSSIPTNWMFGGLPSAERFARTFGTAMKNHGDHG